MNGKLFLLDNSLIPLNNSFFYPTSEVFFISGIYDITKPLFGKLFILLLNWKVVFGNGVQTDILNDFFDR